MKKKYLSMFNFIFKIFCLLFFLNLFSQEQVDSEQLVDGIITDPNVDFILDIDELFAPLEDLENEDQDNQLENFEDEKEVENQEIINSEKVNPIATNNNQNSSNDGSKIKQTFITSSQDSTTNDFRVITKESENKSIKNNISIVIDNKDNDQNNLRNKSKTKLETKPKPKPESRQDKPKSKIHVDELGLQLLKIVKLIRSKNYELALKKLNRLKKYFPENTRIYNMEGSIYYKLKFYEFAVKAWKKSLELDDSQALVEKFIFQLEDF